MNPNGTTVEMMTMTPELAERMLSEKRYDKQRTLRPSNVTSFLNYLERGEFRKDTVIALAGPHGDDFLMDGQHRLSAIIAFQKPVTVTISRRIASDAEVARIYGMYDVAGSVRQIQDVLVARDGEFGEMGILNQRALATAVTIIKTRFNAGSKTRYTANERIDSALDWKAEMSGVLEAIAGCDFIMESRIRRATTLSVALVTMRYARERAMEFWKGVAIADGLSATDPRLKLHDWLIQTQARQLNPRKERITDPVAYRIVAKSWNIFYLSQPVSLLRVQRREVLKPVEILGTPFVEEVG